MDALYSYITGTDHIPTLNAALIGFLFWLGKKRYNTLVEEWGCILKKQREHEATFKSMGITIIREE